MRSDRPVMPGGYGIATGDDGQLPWSWVERECTRARNYWICTTRPDGRPHAKPVWGGWLDEAVLWSTGDSSVSGRTLAANPAVVVHLESGDETAILEGEVAFESAPDVIARFVDAYDAKYDLRPELDRAYALRPRTCLSWTEADYPATATRWVFD